MGRSAAMKKGWGSVLLLPLGVRAGAVVAERIVALTNCLAEAGFTCARDEIDTLLSVARDAIEEGSERSRSRQPHILGGVVAQHFQHLQLIGRDARHPLGEANRVSLQLVL